MAYVNQERKAALAANVKTVGPVLEDLAAANDIEGYVRLWRKLNHLSQDTVPTLLDLAIKSDRLQIIDCRKAL